MSTSVFNQVYIFVTYQIYCRAAFSHPPSLTVCVKVRSAVSGDRRRYKEKDSKLDLDLTYITPNIIGSLSSTFALFSFLLFSLFVRSFFVLLQLCLAPPSHVRSPADLAFPYFTFSLLSPALFSPLLLHQL